MDKVIHRADSRGKSEQSWLHSKHTFSFSSYYDPERMGFGNLRVINDDIVEPGGGFGTHPHENMEIISIPLAGSLRHQDSMGNSHVITQGEVQIMSAGTGLTHSEYNNSDTDKVNFLQIWIQPKELGIEPRYGQRTFDAKDRHNHFQTIASPVDDQQAIWINQDAHLSLADLDQNKTADYPLQHITNGLYLFVIEGEIEVAGEKLARRDAIGLSGIANLSITAIANSQLLLIEVPL